MLLKEYLHSMGIVGFGVRTELPHSLNIIENFEVSSLHYDVLLISRGRIEFPDLYSLLECVRSEFKAGPTYDYDFYVDRGTLLLTPKLVMGRPWGRNVNQLAENLTIWISEYNLTGEWSDEVKRLPRKEYKWTS